MEKIKVKIKVNDYKIENNGIIENDVLKTKDGKTEVEFDLKKLILLRKNNEIYMLMDFKNGEIIYQIPETSKKFYNNFTILSLTNDDKKVKIIYQMEESNFLCLISYETIK